MTNKKGSSKKKTSLFKLNNKRLNKLSKQGKLKKALGKKKLVDFLKERTSSKKFDKRAEPEVEEEKVEADIPLQEADYDYYATADRDYSFLTELSEQKSSKKKRKGLKEEGVNYEGEYARKMRKGEDEGEVRYLLPIKNKKGLIQRCVEVERSHVVDDVDDDDDVGDAEDENGLLDREGNIDNGENDVEEDNNGETEMERCINEEQRKQAMKRFIKEACLHVMQDVEENISKINAVIDHISTRRDLFTMRYAMVSLLEVYKDIVPDYKIRPLSHEELEQKMKKETVKLVTTEECLLKSYKRYLDTLAHLVKGKNLTSKDKNNPSANLLKKKRLLRRQSLACLGDLLIHKSHFNYRTQIIAVLVNAMFHHDTKTCEVACEMVKKMFCADRQGEVTLEIVRLIGRAVKEKKFEVKSKVLDTFLSLRIKYAARGDEGGEGGGEEDERRKKQKALMEKKRKMMVSRKEKKRQKNMKHLEKELKEVSLEDDAKYKSKYQTETIGVVFLTYFRVLKQAHTSTLLSSVLEGLAKFSHLINVSYFDDLFAILAKFVDSGDLTTRQSLHCTQTALTLLMGQGSAFNIDPHNFYVHLYHSLLSFDQCSNSSDVASLLSCLEIMLVQRRRQITQQRCLPYVKRICTLAAALLPSAAVPLLCLVKNVINLFPKCDVLLDTDCIGNGVFLPEVSNPDHCNAHNTSLYELHMLRSSYHSDMRLYSEHLLHLLPRSGRYQLQPSLARMAPGELYKDDFGHVLSHLERIAPREKIGLEGMTEGNKSENKIKDYSKKMGGVKQLNGLKKVPSKKINNYKNISKE